ncbi:uncharacterized protein A4U43_C03F26590 [Asparagus officinalis]|uniref:Uncharacterized protein n=1 Tax=Asparagus officinalis TaxID=4686 RepID=A0A5P1FE05_ASPOF|nr:uncharacterized protein A4U43_C03F26590 [Asparagus officinalis]
MNQARKLKTIGRNEFCGGDLTLVSTWRRRGGDSGAGDEAQGSTSGSDRRRGARIGCGGRRLLGLRGRKGGWRWSARVDGEKMGMVLVWGNINGISKTPKRSWSSAAVDEDPDRWHCKLFVVDPHSFAPSSSTLRRHLRPVVSHYGQIKEARRCLFPPTMTSPTKSLSSAASAKRPALTPSPSSSQSPN